MQLLSAANGPVSAGAMPQPPLQSHHAPKQGQDDTSNASGLSRDDSNASSHATAGAALPAESNNCYLPSMMYAAAPGMPGGAQPLQPASSYTPLPDKVILGQGLPHMTAGAGVGQVGSHAKCLAMYA